MYKALDCRGDRCRRGRAYAERSRFYAENGYAGRKAIEKPRQLKSLGDAKGVGGTAKDTCGGRRATAVPHDNLPRRCASDYSINENQFVTTLPGFNQGKAVAGMGHLAEFTSDQQSGGVVTAMIRAAADDSGHVRSMETRKKWVAQEMQGS